MKYRQNQSGREVYVSNFLNNRGVYRKIFDEDIEPVYNVKLQKLGVDFFVPSRYIFIDEKAAVNYAGTNIRNMVGDYINLSNNNVGWMADKKSLTTHIMQEFIILKDNSKRKTFTESDIFAIDIMFIDFGRLRKYLNDINWDIDTAMEILRDMNDNNVSLRRNPIDSSVELRITNDLREKPAYVRIKKNTLVNKIGAELCHVTCDGEVNLGFMPYNLIPESSRSDWR